MIVSVVLSKLNALLAFSVWSATSYLIVGYSAKSIGVGTGGLKPPNFKVGGA